MASTSPLARQSNWFGLKTMWHWIRAIVRNYWVRVAVLTVIGILIGHWLKEQNYWFEGRCQVYQFLCNLFPQPSHPRRVVLVLIGDEEYWKGSLEGRVPIKRDYLADIVDAASSASPAVVAIDFDLRSPTPDGTLVEFPQYQGETSKFLNAVKRASHQRIKVILPKTIGWDERLESYVDESDIYNGFNFEGGDIRSGYISLPDDTRRVPLALPIKNSTLVDSFSQAIARADDELAVQGFSQATSLPYGSYFKTTDFTVISANELLSGNPQIKERLAHKVVILGGAWHSQGYERGPLIDSYESPVGSIPGVYIHANYVEALLGSKIFWDWKGWSLIGTEAILSLFVAIPFTLKIKPRWKKLLIIVLPYLIIIAISYFSLMNVGLFFDPFIPLILIGAHGAFEQIHHWRAAARKQEQTA
jgi:CHASE2 domain-containing sensor protein